MTAAASTPRTRLCALLALAAPLAAQEAAQRAIDPESGHTYLRTPEPLTIYDAEALAQSLGGKLIALQNFAEETFVLDNFGAAEPYWIGLEAPRAKWASGEKVEFVHWAPNEPTGAPWASFTVMNWEAPGTWHETNGDVTIDRYRALLEFPAGVTPSGAMVMPATRRANRGVLLCAVQGLTARDLQNSRFPALNDLWKRSAWSFDAEADTSLDPLAGLGMVLWSIGSSRSRLTSDDPRKGIHGDNLLARLESTHPDITTAGLFDDVTLTGILLEGRSDLRVSNASMRKGGTDRPMKDALARPTPLCVVATWTGIQIPPAAEPPTEAARMKEIAAVDAELGELLQSLRARPKFAQEEWWIALAGIAPVPDKHTEEDDLRARTAVPVCLVAPDVVPGPIFDDLGLVDLAPTALAFLGIAPRPSWNLDGRALRLRRPAALGTNLIFNGDAEWQSAFSMGNEDPVIAGWRQLGGFHLGKHGDDYPGPPERGSAYLRGNGGALARLEQTIDLRGFADEIDSGKVTYHLAGWLGARKSSNASIQCTLEFLNDQKKPTEAGVLGPVGASELRDAFGAEKGLAEAGMLAREATGKVPRRARAARVVLLATGRGVQHVMADELSLVLSRE